MDPVQWKSYRDRSGMQWNGMAGWQKWRNGIRKNVVVFINCVAVAGPTNRIQVKLGGWVAWYNESINQSINREKLVRLDR